MQTIRVLVTHYRSIALETFTQLFNAQRGIEIVGIASSGEEACELVATLLPNVVLMDVSIPGMSSAEATKRIIHQHPLTRIVAFSSNEDEDSLSVMLQSGASGYVSEQSVFREVILAIRNVAEGRVHIDPLMAGS